MWNAQRWHIPDQKARVLTPGSVTSPEGRGRFINTGHRKGVAAVLSSALLKLYCEPSLTAFPFVIDGQNLLVLSKTSGAIRARSLDVRKEAVNVAIQ